MPGNLFWKEVASRHNANAQEATKSAEMAADAYDTGTAKGRQKVKSLEKKERDAYNYPMGKKRKGK